MSVGALIEFYFKLIICITIPEEPGLITNPKRAPESLACNCWLQTLIKAGIRVILPEIADYEVRRELLRANKISS